MSPYQYSVADIDALARAVLGARQSVPARESLLVAISGVDGSGKGYVAERLVSSLSARGLNAVTLHADDWLSLPHERFNEDRPAAHFYRHAIRFDEMFEQLVLPLKHTRSVHVDVDFAEETASEYKRVSLRYENVDVIVLEGIYLLKRAYRELYDFSVWIDCGFETALERALVRAQEGLGPDATTRAYETIYFAAQLIHFRLDDPRATADAILINDPRLERPA
jgi:uridine kinase